MFVLFDAYKLTIEETNEHCRLLARIRIHQKHSCFFIFKLSPFYYRLDYRRLFIISCQDLSIFKNKRYPYKTHIIYSHSFFIWSHLSCWLWHSFRYIRTCFQNPSHWRCYCSHKSSSNPFKESFGSFPSRSLYRFLYNSCKSRSYLRNSSFKSHFKPFLNIFSFLFRFFFFYILASEIFYYSIKWAC